MVAVERLLTWLEQTPPAVALARSIWLYPAVESVHILGFALLVGAAACLDLRLLGVSRRLPVGLVARHALPLVWLGFALAAVSGVLLLATDATETGLKPVFLAKLALIALAGVNAAFFHARVARSVTAWGLGVMPPPAARLAGLLSLTLWAAVLVLGRLIAYV
ncbi:hypothetical protein V3W47_14995 [Deinococcus sp. YIM 134068]|uniref:hypothetical protein n=1 Tax=Deinococcus lichenicola TaxID=3118910 RepID=UPI002F93EB1B